MNSKKIIKFLLKNYFISIFIACIFFVGFISVYKLFFSKSTYIYAKVKMGQGLWWASTQRPSMWFINALKKGDQETDLTGKPIAELVSIRYYPYYGSSQYDVFLTMKLKVSGMGKSGKYNFKRSTIGVGAPVDFEFPGTQFSGTIINLNNQPFVEKYIEKTIYLTKKYAYLWEFDAIKIGDKYYDGQEVMFEVVDKTMTENNEVITSEFSNRIVNPGVAETRNYITVKAKVKVRKENASLIFGDDQVVNIGRGFGIATPNFVFSDFMIAGIE